MTAKPKRIKVTDVLGNVSYVHHHAARGWCCVLANGTPASFFYAVGRSGLDQEIKFRLEDAKDADERLDIIKAYAGQSRTVEFFA